MSFETNCDITKGWSILKDKIVTKRTNFGGEYDVVWRLTEHHCPKCAEKSVYVDSNDYEYYDERTHICIGCGTSFQLSRIGRMEKTLEELKNA